MFEIRNFKDLGTGRQGYAFSCDLYSGNVKVATVLDEANGGPLDIEMIVPVDIDEMKLYEMVDAHVLDLEFKRICKTRTAIKLKKHTTQQAHMSFDVKYSEAVKKQIHKQFGNDVVEIINERYV